jgi:phosphoribosyl 1,2-cyclic phosphate phosphodiesterase
MKVTFLGTGTSQGVPVIACGCHVCVSADERNKRLRCSVLIELNNQRLIIDTGPDFRQQMLRQKVQSLNAVLYTHEHKDHTAGLDDIRAFNYFMGTSIDLYLNEYVERAIRREFAYIFEEEKYPGIPQVELIRIKNEPFELFGTSVIPVEVSHYKLPVFGFRFGNFCYITDAKTISAHERNKIRGLKILVINALRREPHASHLTLDEALDIIDDVRPEIAYITHISHQLGLHTEVESELPANVKLAYDGLIIEC